MQPLQYRPAETGPLRLPQLGTGSRVPEPGFECVKILEVPQDPAGDFRSLLAGFVKLAPHVCEAAGLHDVRATAFGEAIVGFVAIALEGAAKVRGDDLFQACRGAAGFPVEDDRGGGGE